MRTPPRAPASGSCSGGSGRQRTRRILLIGLFVLPALTGSSQTAALRIHDPSRLVRDHDRYWVFSTGRGGPSAYSMDLTNWVAGPKLFAQPPGWVATEVPNSRGDVWAPDLIGIKGRFLLYYSVSSWGKNTSAIGLAVTPSLEPGDPAYHWTDHGVVIQSASTNDFNAIDPCPFLEDTGRLWLGFGSYWSGIKLVELDPATGKRLAPDSPIHSLAWSTSIEAPFLYRHGDYVYLFVNWGQCCRGVSSTYNIRVGRGRTILGPYLDREGRDLLEGGGTLFRETRGTQVGPGHVGILRDGRKEWVSFHYYDAERDGQASLEVRPLHWTADGWPQVGER